MNICRPHPHGIGQSTKGTLQILLPIQADFWGRTPAVPAGCLPGRLVCPSSHPPGVRPDGDRPARGARADSPLLSLSVTGTSCRSAIGTVLARGWKGLGQVTLGNSLETLDLLRSSARVLSPGEREGNSGLGKGSAIPSLALMASDKAVASGSSDPDRNLANNSAV